MRQAPRTASATPATTIATAVKCPSGPTPAAAAALAASAPSRRPTLQAPWNPDINGRRRSRSTATASVFIATSTTAPTVPKHTRAAASAARSPANAAATSIAAIAGRPARTTAAGCHRRARRPPHQLPTSVPAAIPKSAAPRAVSDRPSACLIAGTRPAHVPMSAAWRTNAVPTVRPLLSCHGIARR